MDDSSEKSQTSYIFVDSMARVEPAKRKLIRKYVMMGKNRGKSRHVERSTGSWENSDSDQDGALGLLVKMRYSNVPHKVGSELSFTQFAAAVEPPLLHDLLKFSFIAKKVMYPLESCIVFHRQAKVDKAWFEFLTSDPAYVHMAVFACQTYISRASLREHDVSRVQTIEHYSAALRLLQERLSRGKEEDITSDPTIMVVLFLTLYCHFMSDSETLKHHLKGLRRIVNMRGGLVAFKDNTKMIMELLKCDLGVALNNATDPVFLSDPYLESLMSLDPASLPSERPYPLASESQWSSAHIGLSANLIQVWTYLRRFCSTINSTAQLKRQLPKEILLNAMASVMYRLLSIKEFAFNSADEVVRLGLLAFSSHIFLNWQDLKVPNTYLSNAYRNCLLNLTHSNVLPPTFLLWLLIIGSMSTFGPVDDSWLLPWVQLNIELSDTGDWNHLRVQLKAYLWIDILHDKPGREIFDNAVVSQTETIDAKGLSGLERSSSKSSMISGLALATY